MARLFPPWSDTAFRVTLVVIVLLGGLVVLGPWIYVRTPYNDGREFTVEQPVQFDHRHHVKDDRIECLYCHSGAEKGPYAGIPSTDVCMGCHNQVWGWSPMLEPVRKSFFTGEPLAWNRVNKLPDFVYFNHAIHVKKGIACANCHGDIENMALARQVAPLTMSFCLDCHRHNALAQKRGVRSLTNCSACHR